MWVSAAAACSSSASPLTFVLQFFCWRWSLAGLRRLRRCGADGQQQHSLDEQSLLLLHVLPPWLSMLGFVFGAVSALGEILCHSVMLIAECFISHRLPEVYWRRSLRPIRRLSHSIAPVSGCRYREGVSAGPVCRSCANAAGSAIVAKRPHEASDRNRHFCGIVD